MKRLLLVLLISLAFIGCDNLDEYEYGFCEINGSQQARTIYCINGIENYLEDNRYRARYLDRFYTCTCYPENAKNFTRRYDE